MRKCDKNAMVDETTHRLRYHEKYVPWLGYKMYPFFYVFFVYIEQGSFDV